MVTSCISHNISSEETEDITRAPVPAAPSVFPFQITSAFVSRKARSVDILGTL